MLQMRNGITAVKAAFGMGDKIDFSASGTLGYMPDGVYELLCAFRYRQSRLLAAVKQFCAIFLKLFWDTSPVIEKVCVAEKYAVDQDNRIFGGADPFVLAGAVASISLFFQPHFQIGERNYLSQND